MGLRGLLEDKAVHIGIGLTCDRLDEIAMDLRNGTTKPLTPEQKAYLESLAFPAIQAGMLTMALSMNGGVTTREADRAVADAIATFSNRLRMTPLPQ